VARAQLAVAEPDRLVEAGVGEPGQLAADLDVEPELELANPEPDQLVCPDPPERGLQLSQGRGPRGNRCDLGYEDLARFSRRR